MTPDFELGRRWGMTMADIYSDERDADVRRLHLLEAVAQYINTHEDVYGLVEVITDANSAFTEEQGG